MDEETHVERHLNDAHVYPGVDRVVGPGQQKMVECVEAHLFAGCLPMGTYTEIVNTASEAATLAVLRALGSGVLGPPHGAPAPCDPPGSDGNQSETDALQPFRRTRPRVVTLLSS